MPLVSDVTDVLLRNYLLALSLTKDCLMPRVCVGPRPINFLVAWHEQYYILIQV